MSKMVVLNTKNLVYITDYPTGSWYDVHESFINLIGGGCTMVEHVRPRGLYTKYGGPIELVDPYEQDGMVSMLVDEEGQFNQFCFNLVASQLYNPEDDFSIMGNVLFVGETVINDGLDFCGIPDEQAELLVRFLVSKGAVKGAVK